MYTSQAVTFQCHCFPEYLPILQVWATCSQTYSFTFGRVKTFHVSELSLPSKPGTFPITLSSVLTGWQMTHRWFILTVNKNGELH